MKSLTSAIKNRLPGGKLYENLHNSRYLAKVARLAAQDADRALINALARKRHPYRRNFFLGERLSQKAWDEYKRNLYRVICENYTSADDENYFDFDGMIFKKPPIDDWKSQKTFVWEFNDMILPILIDDPKLCASVANEGLYEWGNVRLERDDIVIDGGANIGLFSVSAARRGGTVYAFEPNPLVCEELRNTLAKNAYVCMYVCNYALSNRKQKMSFIMDALEERSTSAKLDYGNRADIGDKQKIEIDCIDLDTWALENNIPRIDFIKADIEGAERHMLMGARRVLKEFAPKISICTYHLPDDPQVLRQLILDANPAYVIEEKWSKMYAHVPK